MTTERVFVLTVFVTVVAFVAGWIVGRYWPRHAAWERRSAEFEEAKALHDAEMTLAQDRLRTVLTADERVRLRKAVDEYHRRKADRSVRMLGDSRHA